MASTAPQTASSGFRRVVRRTHGWPAAITILCFGIACHMLLSRAADRNARTLAFAYAAGLGPHPEGDPTEALRRVVLSSSPVAGMAWLEPGEKVLALSPDESTLRPLIARAAKRNQPAIGKVLVSGKRERLTAVPVPCAEPNTRRAAQLVVLLRTPSTWGAWCLATGAFAAVVFLCTRFSAQTLLTWFEGHVTNPVGQITRLAANREDMARARTLLTDEKGGMDGSPAEFHDIFRHLVEAEYRLRRIEREAEIQLRVQEAGLGRKLRRAEDLAITDTLTGLKNRAFLNTELPRLVQQQRDRAAELAIVMLDVDNFKYHNDTKGHKAGDELLRFIGDLLRGSIRPSDHAVRYAGDEFLLILLNINDSQAKTVVERILKLFSQYAATIGSDKPPSLSAGLVTMKSLGANDPNQLILRADAALYAAKRAGKNTVAVSPAA